MITLTAQKINGETILFNPDGTQKAKFPAEQTQPHGNLKTIIINCWRFRLQWKK